MIRKIIGFVLFAIASLIAYAQEVQVLVPYRIGNKWCYSDTLGNVKINVTYDSVTFFEEAFTEDSNEYAAKVYVNKQVSVIDAKGKLLVPPKFSNVTMEEVPYRGFYFITELNGLRGVYINRKELIPAKYDKIINEYNGSYAVSIKYKYGLYNSKGKLIIPVKYDEVRYLKKDKYLVYWKAINDSATVLYKDSLIKNINYGSVVEEVKESGDYTDYRTVTNELDSLKKLYQLEITENKNPVGFLMKGNKYGYWISSTKKLVLPKYDKASLLLEVQKSYQEKLHSKVLIGVIQNDKYGIVNDADEIIFPLKYSKIASDSRFIYFDKDGKRGVWVPYTIYPIIPNKYDDIIYARGLSVNRSWNFAIFKIMINNKTGYVGENGIEFFKD
jgi:hypothetical protein